MKKRFSNKAQISLEYLILIGFIIFIVITLLASAFFYSNLLRDNLKFSQVERYAKNIVLNSESVFYAGEPSKSTINAYLPAGVESVEIVENQILIRVTSSSGLDILSYSANVPIEGILSNTEGLKRIEIVAQSDKVVLSE